MLTISTIFRAIMLMNLGIFGVIIKIAFLLIYLLFLLYAFRRYNFQNAPFGEKAEEFKTPFVATAVATGFFAILLNSWKSPIVIVLLIICEIILIIWCIKKVSEYSADISVIGNVVFWLMVSFFAGQAVMIAIYTIFASVVLAIILFLVFVYIIASEIGSF